MTAMDVPAEGLLTRLLREAVARSKAVTYISWIALALMTTSSVASLRPSPTMAVYGLACIFLYLVPAIVFLLPTSFVSAELASGYEGGVYNWVARGISKPMGFLAVWCQFAMTIFYYPTLLGFVASTLAYVINPELASSGVWTAIVIVVVYWSGVWVSSRGTKGVAGLARWFDHRDTYPWCGAGPARGRLPRPGKPVGRADDRKQPAAGMGRAGEPGADRQQLLVLLGHGDERGPCLIAKGPK